MKKIAIVASSILLTLTNFIPSFAQLGLPVGGGSSVTGAVCTEGQVYTWGLNQQGPAGNIVRGTLGTGNTTAQNINTPQQVLFTVDPTVTIQQLGAGSGGYFLALDCNFRVWAWGDNGAGMLGNGNTVAQVSPQRVIAPGSLGNSELTGLPFRNPTTGQLQGIKKLFAGNSTSLAITDDGRLLAWGCNGGGCDPPGDGLLGDGTTTNRSTPGFVMENATTQLRNVIDISIGDKGAMALVDENQENIGIGTVYTWGTGIGGILGRNAAGTGNTGNETAQSSYARPVRFITNTVGPSSDGYLRNITMIAAGDVVMFAVDVEGYVWAWGDGGWAGATGQGVTQAHSDPRRVIAGLATGDATDGTYLLAQSIAGGNGYAMAVGFDGKPYAWGRNACSANAVGPAATPNFGCGGNLGNNGGNGYPCGGTADVTKSCGPVPVQYGTGQIHNDVVAVARGDSWGYYIRQDNSVWTWGDNIVGQLGVGDYVTRNRAVAFPNIATGCSRPDPKPEAKISPRDTLVCASKLGSVAPATPIVLNAGLQVSTALMAKYEFTWYRVANPASTISASDTSAGNIVKGPILGTTGLTYNAVAAGRYWVRVKYRGTNVPCGGYPAEYDYITIQTYPQTFTVPGFQASPRRQAYCGDTAYVGVTPNGSAGTNPVYSYYTTVTGGTALGTSTGSGITKVLIPNGTANKGTGTVRLYVEETSNQSGVVLTKAQLVDQTFGATENVNNNQAMTPNYQSGFTTKEAITLTSLTLRLRSDIYNPGTTQTATINFAIYGGTAGNGGIVANASKVFGTFAYNFTRTRAATGDPQTLDADYVVPVNITIPAGSTFFISPSATANNTISANSGLAVLRGNTGNQSPVGDDLNPDIVNFVSLSQNFQNNQTGGQFSQGMFFNVRFKTSQGFCDRLPVDVILSCPCNAPAAVTIAGTPALTGNPKTITVCEGGTVPTLSGAYTKGASVNTGNYQYVWFKKPTVPTAISYTNSGSQAAGNATTGVPTLASTTASAGVYYLRVEDGNAGNPSCYKTDSVTLVVNAIPTIVDIPNLNVCQGATVAAIDTSATKPSTTRLVWYTADAPATTGRTFTRPTVNTATASSTTYYVGVVTKGTPACESATRDQVTVAVTGSPSTVNVPDVNVCQGATGVSIDTTVTKPGTTRFVWYTADAPATTGRTFTPPTVNTATATTTTYYVGVVNKATPFCESATRDQVTVTINALPTTVNVPNLTVCQGATGAVIDTSVTKPGTTRFVWYTADAPATTGRTFAPPTVNTASSSTATYYVGVINKVAPLCESAARDQVVVTVNANPTIGGGLTVCEGATITLTGTGTAATATPWVSATTSVATVSNAGVVSGVSAGTSVITYTDNNTCKNTATVTVNPRPTVSAIAAVSGKTQICNNPTDNTSITFTFTGTPNYNFTINGSGATGNRVVTGHTSNTYTLTNVKSAETFTITALADGNTCTATTLGTGVTTSFFEDPAAVGAPTLECDPSNPTGGASGTYRYRILFTGEKGDLPTYVIAARDATNATINGTFGAASGGQRIWTSDYIEESKVVSLAFTDKNGCNPVTRTDLNRVCSCPEKATLSIATGSNSKICEAGDSTFTKLTVATDAGGSGATSFIFNVRDAATNGVVATQASTFPVRVSAIGTYIITDFKGTCEGSTNSVTITNFPSPAASITALDDKFCASTGDKGQVGISVTNPSLANYSIVVARTALADTTVVMSAANGNFFTDKAATYTIKSLKDANGCAAKTTDLTLSAVLNAVTPPTSGISAPTAVGNNATENTTARDAPVAVTAVPVTTGYVGTWTITPPTGTTTASNVATINDLGNFESTTTLVWTVTDNNTPTVCPAATSTLIVTRKNFTEAVANNDSLCVTASVGRVIKGVLKQTTGETAAWTALDGGAFTTNGDMSEITITTLPAVVGNFSVYRFEYVITNTTLTPNVTTKDTAYVKVYATPSTASLAAPTISTCADQTQLNAATPTIGTGLWSDIVGLGAIASTEMNNPTAVLTGLTAQGTTTLKWTVSNGLCTPSSANLTVNQVGVITAPKISFQGGIYTSNDDASGQTRDTLCVSTAYTLTGSTPDPLKGETSFWETIAGATNGIAVSGTGVSKTATPTTAGTATVRYIMNPNPSIPGCSPETTTVVLNSHGIPTGGAIAGADPVCEGTTTQYDVNPLSTSTLPVTYTWDAGTVGASRTGASTGTSTSYLLTSNALGSVTSGTFTATPSNRCGASTALSKTVVINVAPREADFVSSLGAGNDTINGPDALCATSSGVKYKLDELISNTTNTGYVWKWDGVVLNSEVDTSAIKFQDWNTSASSTHTISVELTNACSNAAKTQSYYQTPIRSKSVLIIAPENLAVTIVSDKSQNRFCQPDDQIVFTATPITNLPGGVSGLYTFYRNGNFNDKLKEVATDTANGVYRYIAPARALNSGDQVHVRIDAIPTSQCLTTLSASTSVAMDGFVYPDSIITASALKICEDKQLTLSVRSSRNANTIQWYKDGVLQPQHNGRYTITLGEPSESGKYSVSVPGSVCSAHVSKSDTTAIKIYQKPEFIFTQDPFLVTYADNIKVPMPVFVYPLSDTIKISTWTPNYWLDDANKVYANFVPEREEKDIPYILTLVTGDLSVPSSTCTVSKSLLVINTLPLRIPEAFSPNGDGKNETWVIQGLGKYPKTKVKVFNRWGNAMYTDNDGYNSPWDGTNNGVPLPSATYYYVVELLGSVDNTDGIRSGPLTIVR
jgi:gliding motility-associated-like protein